MNFACVALLCCSLFGIPETMKPGDEPGPGGVPTVTSGRVQEQRSPSGQAPAEVGFLSSRSPSTNRIADRPDYVRSLTEFYRVPEDLSWLEFGLEQRTRFEWRDDFFRAGMQSDGRFLTRTRAYIGIREVLDPIRFGIEFQDSRVFGSDFPEHTGDINETELQQAFMELYLDDERFEGHPLSLRVGRMSFDAVDRRLFARNRFRNTINAFDGCRVRMGDEGAVWELDLFALQPVERRMRQFDHGDDERWIYGVNGYWRGWSPHLVLEPYYFVLDEDRKGTHSVDREIHTLGLHGFGLIGNTGFDYDFNIAYQVGNREDGDHRAHATHAELGYTFSHKWKPRLAAVFNYASGDNDPTDDLQERFDPLFGASHSFYGHSDLFRWQNIINPALYLSLRPDPQLRIEGLYRAYWLASDRDAFVRPGIVDRNGRSGSFVGQEVDLRVRCRLNRHAQLDMGYAHFIPGDFVRNATDSTDDSDFLYIQLRLTL